MVIRYLSNCLKVFLNNIVGGTILFVFISMVYVSYVWFENLMEPNILSLADRISYDYYRIESPKELIVEIEGHDFDEREMMVNVKLYNTGPFRYINITHDIGIYLGTFQVGHCIGGSESTQPLSSITGFAKCHGTVGDEFPDALTLKVINISGIRMEPKDA